MNTVILIAEKSSPYPARTYAGMVEDNTILMNVRALETTKDFIDALCAKADEEGFTVRVSLKPKPQDAPDEGGEDE